MKSPSTKSFPTRSNALPLLARKFVRSRDSKLSSPDKFAGARIMFCLACSETKHNWQIARSAFRLNSREQSSATTATSISRGFEQLSGVTFPSNIAGAQLKVWLAQGEPNGIPWITRSVIHVEMREQALSTEVLVFSRAFERPSDAAWPVRKAGTISFIKKITS